MSNNACGIHTTVYVVHMRKVRAKVCVHVATSKYAADTRVRVGVFQNTLKLAIAPHTSVYHPSVVHICAYGCVYM